MKITRFLAAGLILVVMAGCGGGGGTPAPVSSGPAPGSSGPTTRSYSLALQGSLTAGQAKGVQFDLALPAGVTVTSNPDGTLASSTLALSSGAPSGTLLEARNNSGIVTVALVSVQGLGSGSFATLACNIPAGASPPAGSSFRVSNFEVIDTSGAPVAGVTLSVSDTSTN